MSETKDRVPTASQTIGPFPHEAWQWAVSGSAATGAAALTIAGRLLDGQGEPVNDGWVEAWMPGASAGAMPGFRRLATDEAGRFELALDARPAAGEPAAYITVFARGLVLHQNTAVFLADDAALADAALLAQVPAERRPSLMAVPEEGAREGRYRWDIRLQGGSGEETVFFDYR
jgi:protocatechuate 3,4-dioxygenase alpha subunit